MTEATEHIPTRLKLSESGEDDVSYWLVIPLYVEHSELGQCRSSVDMCCMKASFHAFLLFSVYSARSCWSTGVWDPEWQSLCGDAGQVPHV